MSSEWFDSTYIFTEETRFAGCSYTSSGWFKRIEPPRTFSEPHHDRDNRACRVLSYEFGVVRLYRTFSNYIYTGETRCAGCSCTSSGWFKRIEPPRIFSNHIMTEIAGRVEFFHMSSVWFECTEPSLTTSLQGKQGVQGARALVRGGSSASNLLESHHHRDSKVCRVLPHEFGVVRLYRTFSNNIFPGETSVQGAYALVWGGSSVSNLLEPSRTTSSQR